MSDFFAPAEHPIARKVHRCEMCGLSIEPGKRYAVQEGYYDGQFFRRRLHTHCEAVLDEYLSDSWETEFDYDDIYDWLQQRHCYDECPLSEACIHPEKDWRAMAFQCQRILTAFQPGAAANDNGEPVTANPPHCRAGS